MEEVWSEEDFEEIIYGAAVMFGGSQEVVSDGSYTRIKVNA